MTPPTVLVVEDDRPIRDLLVTVLSRQGFLVRAASTGEEAAELALQQSVDVLLTDVMLPKMTGPELARLIRNRDPRTRVIFMSGYAGSLLRDEEMAAHGFLQKPFDVRLVAEKIRATLDPPVE